MPTPDNFPDGFATDESVYGDEGEDAVTYAGKPVPYDSEQARITRIMRRQREKDQKIRMAKIDFQNAMSGGMVRDPDNLNDAILTGLIKPKPAPFELPVMSGPLIGTDEFTVGAGATSTLPGGFGIHPPKWGSGNRGQRLFEKRLEEQARRRDDQSWLNGLRMGNADEALRMKKSLAVFQSTLGKDRMRLGAYLREQTANNIAAGKPEKPTSFLDRRRFDEWVREQREVEYRTAAAAEGEDSEKAATIRKEIELDPSKKWIDAQERTKRDKHRETEVELNRQKVEELKRAKAKEEAAKEAEKELKANERRQKALDALRGTQSKAWDNSVKDAKYAVSQDINTGFMSPDQIDAKVADLARKIYAREVKRLSRMLTKEDMELIKEFGLEEELFREAAEGAPGPGGVGGAGAAGGSGRVGPPPYRNAARDLARENSAMATASDASAGAFNAEQAQAATEANALADAERAHAAAVAAKAGPPPVQSQYKQEGPVWPPGPVRRAKKAGIQNVDLGRKVASATSALPKGVREGEIVSVGGMKVIIDDAANRSLSDGVFYTDSKGRMHWELGNNEGAATPWNLGEASRDAGMTEEQGAAAAGRVMERSPIEGAEAVGEHVGQFAGADPATLENIARLTAASTGRVAPKLFAEDQARGVPSGSMDGKVADTRRAMAISLLNKMTPEERMLELDRMRADPEKYIAAGVPVWDILGPTGKMT